MSRAVSSRTVYVIGASDTPVKIGVADDPEQRLATLQIGSPDILHIHHAVVVPWALAELIEAEAHGHFKDRHRHGEWFNVEKAEAIDVVELIAARHVAENLARAEGEGDLIEILAAKHELRAGARSAVQTYCSLVSAGEQTFVSHANGYVLKMCGTAAYAAFSLIIAQRRRLPGLKRDEIDKAHKFLAEAINALADFTEKSRWMLQDVKMGQRWKARKRAAAAAVIYLAKQDEAD